MHDQLASGRRFRALNLVDDVPGECLAAVPVTSIPGRRAVRELIELIERQGKPGMIASDRAMGTPPVREPMARGTELTRSAVLVWCGKMGVE